MFTLNQVSPEEAAENLKAARAAYEADPRDIRKNSAKTVAEYNQSKYIREDNTLANAKYLGYLDTRELYPDFNPITFERFLEELLAGKMARPYGS